jgi:hypothetical protein
VDKNVMKKVGSGSEASSEQAGGWNVENASGKSRAAGAADAQQARSAEYIKRNWLVKRACIMMC